MKKVYALLALLLMLPLQACAVEQWKEGEHYEVISDKASSKKEVIEFFSFWCPACYSFEPIVDQLKLKLPEDVAFTKVHVNFMPSTGPEVQDDATRAMMIGRALKKEKQMNTAVFNYIHRQRAMITGLNDLRNIYAINGIEGAEFDKLAKSFGINSMVQKNKKLINQYRRDVRGVPTFIVNGKYKAIFTRGMTPDDRINLILWLSQLN